MHSPIDKEMVLEEFASHLLEADSPETVSLFMKKYPEYAEDILEYAVALVMNKHSSDEPFLNPEERSQFLTRATQIFRQVAGSKTQTFNSLSQRISDVGLSFDQFKEKTGISRFILLNLDQKVVEVSSIPSKILKSIEEILSIPQDVLNNYLSGGTPAQAMNYKASVAPIATNRTSFEEILRQDSSLSEQDRLKLME